MTGFTASGPDGQEVATFRVTAPSNYVTGVRGLDVLVSYPNRLLPTIFCSPLGLCCQCVHMDQYDLDVNSYINITVQDCPLRA